MSPTVIITGASKGIGLAATQFLLADGACIVAIQRSITKELSSLQGAHPKTLRVVQGDSTDPEIIARGIQEALKTFGPIDTVIFNAATNSAVGPVAALPLEGWQKTFDVNLFGIVRFLRAVLPELRDGARIVFISSAASEGGPITLGPYAASKAALNSLNRTLAAENPGKICVAMHPGPVRTEMTGSFAEQAKDYFSESAMAQLYEGLLEPEVPGRVIANVALRAGAELSGKYLHYNDKLLAEL
ncbi:NAD(P)-binding protein [Auricularia subglabra TFB-10046 SS5]|nr:NAD(P)-binding protein [Auricularia subglabra TFB-10046 SS5]